MAQFPSSQHQHLETLGPNSVGSHTVFPGLSTLQVPKHAQDLMITGKWNASSVPTELGVTAGAQTQELHTTSALGSFWSAPVPGHLGPELGRQSHGPWSSEDFPPPPSTGITVRTSSSQIYWGQRALEIIRWQEASIRTEATDTEVIWHHQNQTLPP